MLSTRTYEKPFTCMLIFPARFVICGKLYLSNQNLSHRCDLSGVTYPIFYNCAAELSWSPSRLEISAETLNIFKKNEPGLQPSDNKKKNLGLLGIEYITIALK